MIANRFGLRDPEELASNPIFLSSLPVTHGERVAWPSSRSRAMSWRELYELFPALMRIFSTGNGNPIQSSPKASELKRLRRSTSKRRDASRIGAPPAHWSGEADKPVTRAQESKKPSR